MNQTLFQAILLRLAVSFRRLEGQVAPPKVMVLNGQTCLRYEEKSIQQALIQKLAREVSVLRAATLLLLAGHVQEQALLHRVLDETGEDILFLAVALANDRVTALHERYLEDFWSEEWDDPNDTLRTFRRRNTVPRKKIRAYIANKMSADDPSSFIQASEAVYRGYSGFVHGASVHIMDLCGGGPIHFHINGMLGTPRIEEYWDDLHNYYYRALISMATVAKAFGDAELVEIVYVHLAEFESARGTTYMRDTAIKRL